MPFHFYSIEMKRESSVKSRSDDLSSERRTCGYLHDEELKFLSVNRIPYTSTFPMFARTFDYFSRILALS